MQSITSLLAVAAGAAHAYTIVEADLFMHKNIDPVVIPDQYKSHLHSVFGWDAELEQYDLRKILPGGWIGTAPFELACGPSYCSHGDFINGWLPEAAKNMLNATSKTEFAEVTGPLGGDADEAVCTDPTDTDPDNGTDKLDDDEQTITRKVRS